MNHDSAILAKWSVKEIGRSLAKEGGLVLRMGMNIARFHSSGTLPCWREELIMWASGVASSSQQRIANGSCRNISSGPPAVCWRTLAIVS